MSRDERARSVEAATVYDELFVPALFAGWADVVAEAASLRAGERVLDVACGTGVLARAALERVAPGGAVVGLDADEGMLAVAARHGAPIAWKRGTAESLPFENGAFDAVVSQFGLMFFDDPVAALRETRRVLRPEGRCVFAVWGALEDAPAYVAFTRLLARLFGEGVADGLRAPFAMGDAAAVADRFREAGYEDPQVATRTGTARFPTLERWVEADARGWLQLDDAQHAQLLEAAPAGLGAWVEADGSVRFEMPAHLVSARA